MRAVKNLKVVTSESFKELVLDSDKDVLVYVHLPSQTTPTDLQVLANTYAGENDILVVECSRFSHRTTPFALRARMLTRCIPGLAS
jgi:hypothetical protein